MLSPNDVDVLATEPLDGPPYSSRFNPLLPFYFGGKPFKSLIECIHFSTISYNWIIQLQPEGIVFGKEPKR